MSIELTDAFNLLVSDFDFISMINIKNGALNILKYNEKRMEKLFPNKQYNNISEIKEALIAEITDEDEKENLKYKFDIEIIQKIIDKHTAYYLPVLLSNGTKAILKFMRKAFDELLLAIFLLEDYPELFEGAEIPKDFTYVPIKKIDDRTYTIS